ncbi:DNA-binding MarR family transcriptional regulator [Microbacteriaceae bacterium SG_E_30_P1]|uniref:DNA-binding MarR family transcriptional regulator n=1 Tax=Antiquaquibacter oligotrophicus TaxID=2880260 RepID=A0ABT6KQW0_9MICO|nr:MarR family transcriptional regulator [Antiquaquibacter oligotrophicus]MDH6182201.1 DNA-binding MarR family transcriptional regulator [Antiquaquibacter oligotrophicus]UDF12139.1 MarR family transcriptional regulator [Antiquaquibacter oligotrophicus]
MMTLDHPDAARDTALDTADDLRIAVMRLARRMRIERVDGDVTDGQLAVLFVLAKHGPQTAGALSEHDRVSAPSMTRTVTALVDAGLVVRAPAPDDGRKVLVSLTNEGERIVAETRERRIAWFSRQFDTLSAEDQRALLASTPIIRALADS